MTVPVAEPLTLTTVIGWAVGLIGTTFGATLWLLKDKYDRENAQQDKDITALTKALEDKFSERLLNMARAYDTEIARLLDTLEKMEARDRDRGEKMHALELRVKVLEFFLEIRPSGGN